MVFINLSLHHIWNCFIKIILVFLLRTRRVDSRTRDTATPCLEQLEDRTLLDAYYWTGFKDTKFSTLMNWYDINTKAVATRVPGQGNVGINDAVILDKDQLKGAKNNLIVLDLPSITLTGLAFNQSSKQFTLQLDNTLTIAPYKGGGLDPTYQELASYAYNLSFSCNPSQQAKIDGKGDLIILNKATAALGAGTLSGSGKTIFKDGSSVTFFTNTSADPTMGGVYLVLDHHTLEFGSTSVGAEGHIDVAIKNSPKNIGIILKQATIINRTTFTLTPRNLGTAAAPKLDQQLFPEGTGVSVFENYGIFQVNSIPDPDPNNEMAPTNKANLPVTMVVRFDNHGVVKSNAQLVFQGGGTSDGTFSASRELYTYFIFSSPNNGPPATYVWNTGVRFVGAGGNRPPLAAVASATLQVKGNVRIPAFYLSHEGKVEGAGSLTVDHLTWASGTMTGTGTTTVLGTGDIGSEILNQAIVARNFPNLVTIIYTPSKKPLNVQLSGRKFINNGTVVVDNLGGANGFKITNGSVFTNNKTFTIENGSNIRGDNKSKFIDNGTLEGYNGKNWLGLPYSSRRSSLTEVDPNSALVLDDLSPVQGTIQVSTATLLTSSRVDLEGGVLASIGVSTLVGDLENNGTVEGIVPGLPNSFSSLTVQGNYSQPSGSLNIGIGGTTPGTQFDQLTVTGEAFLAGTLNISLVNSFMPSLGQTFQIVNYGSHTGNFQAITGLQLGSYQFDVQYNSTNVTLVVVAASSPPAPTVTGLSASTGTTAGGTSATITGTNFSHVTGVSFGTTPATSFTVNSATSITAIAPPHATGTIDATVTTATGTSATSSNDQFTYTLGTGPTVSGVSPNIGDPAGDMTWVTITGTNFLGTTAVNFGTTPADYFVVNSATQITTLAPAHIAGTVDITVSTYSGTSSTSSADQFTYADVPSISSVTASLGSTGGGNSVTLAGSNFTGADTVLFGSVLASSFTVNSDSSITAVVPPEAAGNVDVAVSNASGTSALVSGDRYSYVAVAAPAVSSLGTSTGTTAGGTSVVVNGSGFTGADDVTFGGIDASSFVVNSDSQITAVAPPDYAGTYDVVVYTPTGDSATSSSDLFTYTNAAVPAVTSLPLNSGSTAGGSVVTVLGSGFTGTTAVNFGSVAATDFTVLSDGTLTATAPAQAAGMVDVTVTSYSGTSSTSSANDRFAYNAAPAPALMALSATSGLSTGGNTVVLTGSNFTGATAVNFGSVGADFNVLSDNAIEAFAPAQAAGTVNVTVATYSGTSSPLSYTYTAAPLPAVTGLSTSSGSTAGGTLVEINGSGFTNASEVDFGSQAVYDFTVNSDSQISVVAPPNYPGTVDVLVTTAAGQSVPVSSDRFSYTAAAAPAVTGLDTTSGSTAGGTAVNISGSGFTGATDVFFGGIEASSFTVNSDSSISAVAPPNAAGTVDVTVVTFSGTSASTSADHFTYTSAGAPAVTSLATSSGTTAGGTLVGISGYGFTGATAVNFGSVAASSFTVDSDTLITAVAPPQAAGTVDVIVCTYGGTSSTGSADHFTYSNAAAPAITGLTPGTGTTAGGATVTILGSGFTGATGVNFGSLAAAFTVNSDSSITATSPLTAAGTVDVRVTTFSGTSAVVSADHFTTTNLTAPAPAISGVSPNTGSTAGGQVVTISGSNFTGTTGVSFGGTAATSFTILSDSTLTATAPPGSAGTVDVQVTTNNGTSSTGAADQFTYEVTPAPSIVSLSPSNGTSAGGASVTITGTNFTGTTAVSFGGIPATNFSVTLPTTITATAPPLPAGSYDVTVTTPSGTSAPSTFTVTAAAVPTLTSLGTTTGTTAGGTSVSITGTGFTGAIAVNFGGVAASSFTVNSNTSITATAPPQYAGTVDVSVSTYSGTTANSTADRFTYTLASLPAISSLGTSSGSTAGGTAVTINGSGFTGATAVSFGTVAASSFTVVSDTQISAVTPPQYAGMVDVQVTTYSGSSAEVSADRFTYTAASVPAVTALGTHTGTTAGGTAVTISGSGFTGATAVNFGSVAAASFSVLSDTQISAVSPPQAAGSVFVTVTTFSGTSSTGSGSQFGYTNAAAPAVSGVSANSGSAAGGATVTVTGSGFTGATAVNFGTTAATDFTVLADSALLATAPAGSAGTVDVTVSTWSGTSSTGSADHYTDTAVTAPAITSLNPSTASTGGGTVVTISGSGFLNATGVNFGSTPAASFVIVSDGTISATVPPLPAGTVDVTVTAYGTTSALNGSDRFTSSAANAPVVSGLSTSSGTTAGGTSVTITGSGFTGAGSVSFGGVAATSFTVNSDTSISAVSPSQAAGTVDVVVSTPTGTSATATADHFTYTNAAAPAVTGLSLSGGSSSGGTVVTVTGSGFTGATAVNFGSVAAGFTVNSDGYLVATAPAQAAGTVDVTVTTPSGTSALVAADHFTYTAASAPAVTGVSPNSGSGSGGGTVTVLGSGFTGASAVNFGTTAATDFTVLSDSALTATAPAGSAGTVDVTVVSPSGTSATGSADQYHYTATSAPAVSGISPSSGSANGGTTVFVGGSGFTGATAVNFGGYAATFTVNSDSMLTALAPAQAAGVVDVTVTTAAGTSSSSSNDRFTYNSAAAPTVTGVSPNAGPNSGGAGVTVSGSGFTGATAVYFGTVAAPNFSVSSDGVLEAESPAESAGTVDITVVTPNGTSATGAADRYTFQADAPLTAVAGINISATAGSQFNGAVASFTDTDTGGSASQFSAYIDWGSGQHSTGYIAANGYNGSGQPQFLVYGINTYASAGSYTITVSIQDSGGAGGQAMATATVSNPPHAPGQARPAATGTTATATHGVAFKGSVASFSGPATGSYAATINWGNGITTAGSIVGTSPTTFSVVGSNSYAAAGVYTVSITISLSGGGSSTVETTITVADATLPEMEEPPDAPAVAVADLAQEEIFGDFGWLLDLGDTEEVSFDPRCVDAVLMAAANGSAEEVETAPAVLDGEFAEDD